jgi:hypothetical protein
MGRVYAVTFEGTAVTAQVDFFEVLPADDKPVRILGLFLSQSSDVADAAEEILRVQIIRGHATTGSGGASPTPTPTSPNDTAAGFVSETLNTTIASAGAAVNLFAHAFNIRVGLEVWYPQGAEPVCSQAAGTMLVVRLMAAPADSLTMSGTLIVEELV